MNIYRTELEQTEMIKKWFKKYGHTLSWVVLSILLVVAGYRLWENHTLKINSQSSERYQQLIAAVANDDPTMIAAQVDDLSNHYSDTIYAEAALLTQAKLFVSEQKWTEALAKFNEVITEGNNPALRQIARLRSARILCILNTPEHYQNALNMLDTVEDPAYLAAIQEMKGDIFVELKDKKQAQQFYKDAMGNFEKGGLSSPFLEMKLNNIT